MFLKVINPTVKLPWVIVLRGKGFVFPAVPRLPSVCIEEFTDAEGAALLKRAPKVYASATKDEVEAAKKLAASQPLVPQTPVPPKGTLTKDTALAGSVKAGDVLEFTGKEVGDFLQESALPAETARQLLVFLQENGGKKVSQEAVQAYLDAVEVEGQG